MWLYALSGANFIAGIFGSTTAADTEQAEINLQSTIAKLQASETSVANINKADQVITQQQAMSSARNLVSAPLITETMNKFSLDEENNKLNLLTKEAGFAAEREKVEEQEYSGIFNSFEKSFEMLKGL